MLVHIVNAANCTFYANYIAQIQRQRLQEAEEMAKTELAALPFFKKFTSELNEIKDKEYLLTISSSGDLIDYCICSPTKSGGVLTGAISSFVSEEVKTGPKVWIYQHKGAIIELDEFQHEKSLAYFCTGLIEWSLTKGVKFLLGLVEEPCAELAVNIGVFKRVLGKKQAYLGTKTAQAIELVPDKRTLENARLAFNIQTPVTYVAPPQFDYREISQSQIAFIDAALHASQSSENEINLDS